MVAKKNVPLVRQVGERTGEGTGGKKGPKKFEGRKKDGVS